MNIEVGKAYRMRCGDKAIIKQEFDPPLNKLGTDYSFSGELFCGEDSEGDGWTWTRDGSYGGGGGHEDAWDIVGPWIEEQQKETP